MRLLLLLLLVLSGGVSQASDYSFREAKVVMREQVLPLHPVTLYCGCPVILAGKKPSPDLAACGYQTRKDAERAARLEWEHVVPAWVLGHQRQCWQSGGRENCKRTDTVFRAMEADMHNLSPAIGEVNGDRSNFPLTMLDDKPSQYGACPMVVNFKQKTAMPPEGARGASARIYLYMADRYKLRLSKLDRRVYEAWNRQYPVSDWERDRVPPSGVTERRQKRRQA